MGLLAPVLLALAAAAAIPLLLHLLQRHQGPRVVFPALRYLRRAERESARRVRLRQLLLLAMRMGIIVLLAAAAARPFLRGGSARHEPTAVVIVLDNSASTGLVVGDRRIIDHLKGMAAATLGSAADDDLFWVLRAAEPWDAARPGGAREAAARIANTDAVAAGADLASSLERARALLEAGAGGRRAEIHLLSDLQAPAFTDPVAAGGPPVVVWHPGTAPPPNRGITDAAVAGGLPPRGGQRTTLSVTARGAEDSIPVRVFLDGQLRVAGSVPVDAAGLLPLPPLQEGTVTGRVETDPDALRSDDRRYFVLEVLPPPAVALRGELPFVAEAVAVLGEAGRIRPAREAGTRPSDADVVFSRAGEGLESSRESGTFVVIPPPTPVELPALNRRLSDAGVPWRLSAGDGTATRFDAALVDPDLRGALEGVGVRRSYRLEPAGQDTVLLRLADGSPWAVAGTLPGGARYVLVATPFLPDHGELATSAAMVPLVERFTGEWSGAWAGALSVEAGSTLTLPGRAREVEYPDGDRRHVEGGAPLTLPGPAGIYRLHGDAGVIGSFAVNSPASESDLTRVPPGELAELLPDRPVVIVQDAADWTAQVYRARRGPELWRVFAVAGALLLLVEMLVAASGRRRAGSSGDAPEIEERADVSGGAALGSAGAR